MKKFLILTAVVGLLIGCNESPVAPNVQRVVDTMYNYNSDTIHVFHEGIDTVYLQNINYDTVFVYDTIHHNYNVEKDNDDLVKLIIEFRVDVQNNGWVTDGYKTLANLPHDTNVEVLIQRGRTAYVNWQNMDHRLRQRDSLITADSTYWRVR